MIDPENTWKSTFENLPVTLDSSWASNIANWAANHVAAAELTNVTTATPPFVFKKAIFQAQLTAMTPTLSASDGITQLANAWETAILASTVLLVLPGDSVGGGGPANTWSVVSSALINPASIAAGKNIILSLMYEQGVLSRSESPFPAKIRGAFLALKGDITGLNQVPPPAGPNPLVSLNTAFK